MIQRIIRIVQIKKVSNVALHETLPGQRSSPWVRRGVVLISYFSYPETRFKRREIGRYAAKSPGLRRLIATRIIGERTANEHVIQKPAAARDFRQRRIILQGDRKTTRLNSSHTSNSYSVF